MPIITNLNTLELKPAGRYCSLGLVFEVWVDGKPYLDTIKAFEERFPHGPAGAYVAALGEEAIMEFMPCGDCRLIPFACDCGVWECWWLGCQAVQYGNVVYWKNWENPHRADKGKPDYYWDYAELPPLIFEKSAYLHEVRQAQATIRASGAIATV